MTDDPERSPLGMIGTPPSARGLSPIPTDPAEHAVRFAREWHDVAETYVQRRMRDLGIPEDRIGASSREHDILRSAFNPHDRDGGGITTGVTVNSGCAQP